MPNSDTADFRPEEIKTDNESKLKAEVTAPNLPGDTASTSTQPTSSDSEWTDEEADWLAGFSDRASAEADRKARTYPGPLLRAILRACEVFSGKQQTHAYVYPDGTGFWKGDVAAIWIYSSELRGLDLRLPLAAKLRGDEVEVIPVEGGVDLLSKGPTVRCLLATASSVVAPPMPETSHRMLYRPDQAKNALMGKSNEMLSLQREEADPWRLHIDGHTVTLDRGAEPSTAPFAGRARRQHLAALFTRTQQPYFEQLEVCRKNDAVGLITSVSQSFSGSKVTVTRFVALAPMRGAQP